MHGLILFFLIAFLFWFGRSIFIPLLAALFLWYLINAIATYFRRVMPLHTPDNRAKHYWWAKILDWVSRILSVASICGLIYLFATQIRPMLSELLAALPALQHRLISMMAYLSESFGVTLDINMLPNITKFISNIGASAVGMLTSTGMILVYMLFLFIEQSTFNRKFASMFHDKRQSKKMRYILDSIDDNMKKYLFVKTIISGATGLTSYLWLHTLGVGFAGVWAFIIFVMNYIPTIGSIVACALPILYTLTIAQSLQLPILTACGLISLQILLGNIIEPRLTGHTLNLSTLAILINLVFWGMIWGIPGMFFSVPLLVAIFIITAQFDSTRWIAVLLSANGNIPDKRED